jgi:CRISPR/Cas system-associated exonuclease Cas4 (RecB family)
MPHISALQKRSYDALGHHVEQRLSGSVDHKAAQTRDSRLVHFLAYIDEYKLTDKYLNHSSSIVDDILSRYVLLLFMGYGCTPRHIKSGTVLGYLMVINAHYTEMGIHPPFAAKSKTRQHVSSQTLRSSSSNRTVANLFPTKHSTRCANSHAPDLLQASEPWFRM